MIRIFLSPEQLSSEQVIIAGNQAKHLSVLRVKIGEIITAFDGLGYKYDCKILKINKKEFIAEKLGKAPYSAESPVSITLAQGIAKGEKMDFIIQKATELGVNKVVPLITEYSQVRHTAKAERWRNIALSASEQSGRGIVLKLNHQLYYRLLGTMAGGGSLSGTNWRHAYFADWPSLGGTVTNVAGLWIDKQTLVTINYGIVLYGDGAGSDIVFGTGNIALSSIFLLA